MATANVSPLAEPEPPAAAFADPVRRWLTAQGAWYAASFVLHMVMACALMLVSVQMKHRTGDVPEILEAQQEPEPKQEVLFNQPDTIGVTPVEPSVLNTDMLTQTAPPGELVKSETASGDTPSILPPGGDPMSAVTAPQLMGSGNFDIRGILDGPARRGRSGLGECQGPGVSGPGIGFGPRSGHHKEGTTGPSEHAVATALLWLAHHQNADGSWSFINFSRQCKTGDACSGPGSNNSDAAATAVALLPFLGAGQTHEGKGPYRTNIYKALSWLLSHQAKNGSLAAGSGNVMYSHGLATIAMCEAFGLTNDKILGKAAQAAVNFIVSAQHPETGGWRYMPGMEGDTSVLGWQVMALKSAQLAYLNVDPKAMTGANHFLDLVAGGDYKGRFAYTPGGGSLTPTMTAVGLLCRQYLGMKRDDMAMREGMDALMKELPQPNTRPLYFWYYATQVMHNLSGPEWDKWNRAMRRVLIDTQCKEGCAAGSWDPDRPAADPFLSAQGGRVLITGLSTLTLEVYYRYLPLYRSDAGAHGGEAAPPKNEK